jgi:hypothetical protein
MADEKYSGPVGPVGFQVDEKAQADAQKKLADRLSANAGPSSADRDEAVTTNTLLTTKEHTGKRSAEPDKPDEQEARKVGRQIKQGPPVKTFEISTHESGEATDTVTLPTNPAEIPQHPNTHLNDAVGIGHVRAQVAAQESGDKDEDGKPVGLAAPEVVGEVTEHDGGYVEPGSDEDYTGPDPARLRQRKGESKKDFEARKADAQAKFNASSSGS